MAITDRLAPLRAHTGTRRTTGLDDSTVERFASSHPDLVEAIDAAVVEHERVRAEFPELMHLDEAEQARVVQGGYVNFYSDDTVNPYVALVARGPWIVTLNGAVLHDSGGYGMLGFGHTPEQVLGAMARPQVMANIMKDGDIELSIRLPGFGALASNPITPNALGVPGFRAKSSISSLSSTPVPGATSPEPYSRLTVCVADTRLPSRSMIEKCVVSSSSSGAG